MRDVTGQGCYDPAAPVRDNLPLHDMSGGSAWMLSILPLIEPGLDVAALKDGQDRARRMLRLAAEIETRRAGGDLVVKVINNTGHKLPTGYPEGRRIWLNVRFFDRQGVLLGESGAYDFDTAELIHDADLKVYEVIPVVGENIAGAVGLPAGTEFHFVLNNEIAKDNRIPPLGFTNAAFDTFGGTPIGAAYADGQNWDETRYAIPPVAVRAQVTLYYQSVSREFVEFLRDNGAPGGDAQQFYEIWLQNGMCPPEVMGTREVMFAARGSAVAQPGESATPAVPTPRAP